MPAHWPFPFSSVLGGSYILMAIALAVAGDQLRLTSWPRHSWPWPRPYYAIHWWTPDASNLGQGVKYPLEFFICTLVFKPQRPTMRGDRRACLDLRSSVRPFDHTLHSARHTIINLARRAFLNWVLVEHRPAVCALPCLGTVMPKPNVCPLQCVLLSMLSINSNSDIIIMLKDSCEFEHSKKGFLCTLITMPSCPPIVVLCQGWPEWICTLVVFT